MIGLALSGGGSRAIAFHLGCLRALDDLDILERVNVLSTISGGSIIGAYYAYTPNIGFAEFERDIRRFLRSGFEAKIAIELAKPQNFVPCLVSFILSYLQEIVALCSKVKPFRRPISRTNMFQRVLNRHLFSAKKMDSSRRNDMEIVIGACELRTGSAFRFGPNRSGGWRQGGIVRNDIDVALAVAASAAYPLFLPAIDLMLTFKRNGEERKERVLLTDGGVYDNLGLQVLEPGRDPEISLHTFPCDYIIACNAGHGQEEGQALPTTFFPRVRRSFDVVHRRVQDLTMHRLHQLKQAGFIKGFALPYLGQQDNRLPWHPSTLVPRTEVVNYPTNFRAMSEQWINKLSERGEQLTRALVSYYLRDLL